MTCCRSAAVSFAAFSNRYPLISFSKKPSPGESPAASIGEVCEVLGIEVVAPGCSSPARTPLMPPAGDLEGDSEGSLSEIPTPIDLRSAFARSYRARWSPRCSSVKSSSSRMIRWGISSPWALLRPDQRSKRLNESGVGGFCKGDSLSTSSNFSTPLVTSKSSGLRFLTTDFAAPWSFCHMRGAASFLSLSFRERSYHLQLVAKESNELGSPSHIGTTVCSGIRARTGSSPRPNQLLRWPCNWSRW